MSDLKQKYKELKKLQRDIMEKDHKIDYINKQVQKLQDSCIDSLKTTVNLSIENIVSQYFEKYPYGDNFLMEANNRIDDELKKLNEKVQQEEIDKKVKFDNLFGGFI